MAVTRIMLVEDDPSWQVGVDALLSGEEGLDLVAVTDNFDAAMALFEAEKPDVVLLDWQINGEKDGIEVGKALLAQGFPADRMILVTGSDPAILPPHPFRLVPKARIASDLIYAIQDIAGEMVELAKNSSTR